MSTPHREKTPEVVQWVVSGSVVLIVLMLLALLASRFVNGDRKDGVSLESMSPAERLIHAGEEDFWEIPERGASRELHVKFPEGELAEFGELNRWLDPLGPASYQDAQLEFEVRENGRVTWPRKVYEPKDGAIRFGRGEVEIFVSRGPGTAPVYIRCKRSLLPFHFGTRGGPWGNHKADARQN